jgi:hypothetical protein
VYANRQHRLDPQAASPSQRLFSFPSIQPLCLQSLTDSPTQRATRISFSFNRLRTLFNTTEGVPPLLPFWNSSPLLTTLILALSFHALTKCKFRNSFLLIFIQNARGCTPSTFGRSDLRTLRSKLHFGCGAEIPTRSGRSPIRPIAAKRLWCHNPQRRENSSPSGETTPLPPVSKDSERTSGTARFWSPLQVVPRSSVLKRVSGFVLTNPEPKLDRSAGWLDSCIRQGCW